MIKSIHCNQKMGFCPLDNLNEISDLLENKESLIWLDLESPTPDELRLISEEFNLHPLAMEDVTHSHQRPKVDEYEGYYFVIFYALSMNEKQQIHLMELNMFMGENYLVTVHKFPIKELMDAEKRWKNNRTIDSGIGILLYSLLDSLVDNYFPVLDTLVDEVETLEDEIFQEVTPRTNRTSRILELKKKFIQLRRTITPERDVLNTLTRRDSPIFNSKTILYFQDVYDHLLRVTDTIDTYRDQLGSVLDANLSVTSNDLNKVMRTLTATSIILMTDALIAGIYGMNFENMPELKWPFGYFGALALMVGVALGIYYYFKRRNWF